MNKEKKSVINEIFLKVSKKKRKFKNLIFYVILLIIKILTYFLCS